MQHSVGRIHKINFVQQAEASLVVFGQVRWAGFSGAVEIFFRQRCLGRLVNEAMESEAEASHHEAEAEAKVEDTN